MSLYVRAIDQMSNHTAADLRGFLADFIDTPGVLDLNGGHCLVVENGSPNMSVNVGQGIVYVSNSLFTEFSDEQKFWDILIDATANVVINSNASGSTRYDLICIKVDTGVVPDANASNVATVVAVQGTPGAGIPATPSDYLLLATVEVADGETSITNAEITDARTQIGTNTRLIDTKTITTITSSATPTPVIGSEKNYLDITALATNATVAAPTGTPVNKDVLVIQIKDNATPRTLAWNAIYREVGIDLPTTTSTSKIMYIGFMYNATDNKWDLLAVNEEE